MIVRDHKEGAWQVDEVDELYDITDGELRHGDDAFVVNDDTWWKYSKSLGTWQLMSNPGDE